jgi:hypothetical protein
MYAPASSSILVLLRTNVSNAGGPVASSRGKRAARALERRERIPDKFKYKHFLPTCSMKSNNAVLDVVHSFGFDMRLTERKFGKAFNIGVNA